MAKLQRGYVVRKEIPDEHGKNPKPHPIVILTRDEDCDQYDEIVGVVASHSAAKRPDPDCLHLPHVPGGSPRCAFGKETVAVCRWTVRVKQSETSAEQIIGRVQLKHLVPVIAKVKELAKKKREAKQNKPGTTP